MAQHQDPNTARKSGQPAGRHPDPRDSAPRRRNVLVRDHGFATDDWLGEFLVWNADAGASELQDCAALDVENTALADRIAPVFDQVALIRITFPSHTDGRGFSLARHLRLLGYRGRLRACGHVLADQYAMARRSGFDEVEISPSLAERQPEVQWLFRAEWQALHYQDRLRAPPRDRLGQEGA